MLTDHKTCFQFKASFSPCTILQIMDYDLETLEKQIEITVSRAPNIFLGSPVVIDLEKIQSCNVDFIQLKQILIKVGLVPMGVRGCNIEQSAAAAIGGLPIVNVGKRATALPPFEKGGSGGISIESTESPKQEAQPSEIEESTTEPGGAKLSPRAPQTKIITHPVRSGMQVYAKEADLVIIGPVSHGAELLADGNIHIYGSLRGRALAGLSDNTQARIFCRSLEAELVSIAGFYLTKEDIQALPQHSGMIQIYLENEQVKIESL